MRVRVKCPNCKSTLLVREGLNSPPFKCPCCSAMLSFSAGGVRSQVQVQSLGAANKESTAAYSLLALSIKRTIDKIESIRFNNARRCARGKTHRRGDHADQHEEAWDITPMIDVSFLLLIFFMITASFSVQKVIRTGRTPSDELAASSSSESPKDENEEELGPIIQVDEFNGFAVLHSDGSLEEAASKQDLILTLVKAKQEYGVDEVVTLKVVAHEESTHGAVVTALDAARAAKFTRFRTETVESF